MLWTPFLVRRMEQHSREKDQAINELHAEEIRAATAAGGEHTNYCVM